MSFDAAQFRQGQRKMWSSGDWPSIASTIQPVADQLVERMDVSAGQDVLDVGAGDGNVSIRAAERGARVTASDITPELFESGRSRAADAGVEIEWVEGDAADLPFARRVLRRRACRPSAASSPRATRTRPTRWCASPGRVAPSVCAPGPPRASTARC